MGRLLDLMGAAGPRILGIPLNATVKEALGPNGWRLRRTRLPHLTPIIELIRSQRLPSSSQGPDLFLWRHEVDDFKQYFSTHKTWEQVRIHSVLVDWRRVVVQSRHTTVCFYLMVSDP